MRIGKFNPKYCITMDQAKCCHCGKSASYVVSANSVSIHLCEQDIHVLYAGLRRMLPLPEREERK